MRPLLFALVVLSVTTPALAASRGGGNAIANDTTTSMGEPLDSPSFTAPRSAAIAGTPANRRALELGQDPVLVSRCATFTPKPGCHAPLP
ncbi:MAG TPA: hypothetical protein VFA03_16710 [Acetobacteraceae bacterium]|nr:hypothetical protein [Acetobacteraceae bacterium]